MMIPNCVNNELICNVVDESLSILFDDDMEQGHIFGDQSMVELGSNNAFVAPGSSYNKHHRRSSSNFKEGSAACAWHGSCASFRGNNSNELLHFSTTLDDSNHSSMFIILGTTASIATSSQQHRGVYRESSKVAGKEKITMLTDSRFNDSTLMSGSSTIVDIVPRKPVRETDADPYSTLEERMSDLQSIFYSADSKSSDGSLSECTHEHSMSVIDTIRKPKDVPMDMRRFESSGIDELSALTIKCPKLKEDSTPKRPSRGLSPVPIPR